MLDIEQLLKVNFRYFTGYSHNIVFDIPTELRVAAETEKGKAPIVTISGVISN